MKISNILLENSILDGAVKLHPHNFMEFKEYAKEKFKQEDTIKNPPLAVNKVKDPVYGIYYVGYTSKDHAYFKYFPEDLELFYDTKAFPTVEVQKFSTVTEF